MGDDSAEALHGFRRPECHVHFRAGIVILNEVAMIYSYSISSKNQQLMTFSERIGQINAISVNYQFSYSCCEQAVPNETDTKTVSIVE